VEIVTKTRLKQDIKMPKVEIVVTLSVEEITSALIERAKAKLSVTGGSRLEFLYNEQRIVNGARILFQYTQKD
jgi:hypothetical protein